MNKNQKGGNLEGGAATLEVLESSADILKQGQGGNLKGLQQWYTPEEAAKLVVRVFGGEDRWTLPTFDPTAGDGSLLRFVDPARSFGVEIDNDQIKAAEGSYQAIHGDIKDLMGLMMRILPAFDSIVANPPFGLEDWSHGMIEEGKKLGSTALTWAFCQEMLSQDGQMAFIAGKNRFYREIADRDDAKGIYFVVECDDLFEGTTEPCVIAFAVHPSLRVRAAYESGQGYIDTEGYETKRCPLSLLDILPPIIREARSKAVGGNRVSTYSYSGAAPYVEAWEAIIEEHKRQTRMKKGQAVAHKFDIWAEGNKLRVKPSAFAQLALAKHNFARKVLAMHNKKLNWFASYPADYEVLREALELGVLTIDSKCEGQIEAAIAERKKNELPLYPIKETQRIGFLKNHRKIQARINDEERQITAGEWYEIEVQQKDIETPKVEYKVIERGENAGEMKEVKYLYTERYLQISIRNDAGRWNHFYDSPNHQEDIKYLVKAFDLPDPGNVADLYPDEVMANRETLWAVQRELVENAAKYDAANPKQKKKPFKKLRHFQVEDLSRMLIKNTGLLAWHQGLGKTPGAIAWMKALVKQNRAKDRLLIVCPGDLMLQWSKEIKRLTGREVTIIRTHAEAVAVRNHFKKGGVGWYITYYEALATNGVRGKTKVKEDFTVETKEEKVRKTGTGRRGDGVMAYQDKINEHWTAISREQYRDMDYYARQDKGVQLIPRRDDFPYRPPTDGGPPMMMYGYINPVYDTKIKVLTTKHLCPMCKAERGKGWNGMACTAIDRDGNRCTYVHWVHRVKPMGSLLSTTFRNGAIVVDEGTMISGDTSKRSEVIRGLNSKHKLLMTGTPIKEYIPHAFWPLWWALGNNSPRFPFGYNDKRDFEDKHAVIRYTIVANKRAARKVMPKVTGLSSLWAMLPASVIRRRKEETGEPLVKHTIHPVTVPLGVWQVDQIQQWIARFPDWFMETHPDSDVVTKGGRAVVEQMTPMLGLAQKLEWAATCPLGDADWEWTGVEGLSNWTPANLRTVLITMSLVKKGRKVIVGSSLVKEAEFLAAALAEKGVNVVSFVDESGTTINPKKRAKMVETFQEGGADVIVTTQKSLRFGHNVDAATAMVVQGLPWEFEVWDQFISRHHRFTSDRPVDTYVIIPGNESPIEQHDQPTVNRRKWNLLKDKGEAAMLALDGRLIEADIDDITQEEVAKELMESGFNLVGNEVPEHEVEAYWETVPQIDSFVVKEEWLEGDILEEDEGPYAWDVFTQVIGDFTAVPLGIPEKTGEPRVFEDPEPYWVEPMPEGYKCPDCGNDFLECNDHTPVEGLVADVTKFSDPHVEPISDFADEGTELCECGHWIEEHGGHIDDDKCGAPECTCPAYYHDTTQEAPAQETESFVADDPGVEQEAEPVAEVEETPVAAVTTEAPAPSSNLLAELKELAQMYKDGILTESEFIEYKAALAEEHAAKRRGA